MRITKRQLKLVIKEELAKLLKENDITFKPEKEAVGWDFGELFNSIRGGYTETFRDALLPIAINAKGKLLDTANELLRKAAQGGDISNPMIAKAAGKVRAQLNDIGQELVDSGYLKADELVENYMPRLWNRRAIKKNPEEFKRLLIEDGQVSPEGAPQLIRDILNKKYEFGEGGSGSYFMLSGRRFDKITDDSKYVEFLNKTGAEIFSTSTIITLDDRNNYKNQVVEDFNFIRSFDKILFSNSTFAWWSSVLSEASEVYFNSDWQLRHKNGKIKLGETNYKNWKGYSEEVTND